MTWASQGRLDGGMHEIVDHREAPQFYPPD
jgi:hypothetical protein